MPRIRQKMEQYQSADMARHIRVRMAEIGIRSVEELAERMQGGACHISAATLRNRLKDPGKFTLQEVRCLNDVLYLDMEPLNKLTGTWRPRELKNTTAEEVPHV